MKNLLIASAMILSLHLTGLAAESNQPTDASTPQVTATPARNELVARPAAPPRQPEATAPQNAGRKSRAPGAPVPDLRIDRENMRVIER